MTGTEDGTKLVPLSAHELTRLAHCEAVIQQGLDTFVSVGAAITEIREHALYKGKYETFEAYLKERWGISRKRAYQLQAATTVSRILRDTPTKSGKPREILPDNERQVRALAAVPDERVPDVWDSAVDSAGGRVPTGREVEEAVERFESEQSKSSRRVLHSSESVEWYTPSYIIEPVRKILGNIDLDPASCDEANQIVKAAYWNTESTNGLLEAWYGRVWCNPPYGKTDGQSNQAAWLRKAIEEVGRGACEVVAMLLNAHIGTKWFRTVWQYPLCILDERVRFVGPGSTPGDSPTHGSVIVFVTRDNIAYEALMAEHLKGLGVVSFPTQFDNVVEIGEPIGG